MAKEILNCYVMEFTMVMLWNLPWLCITRRIYGQRSYKPQTKHAERM